MTSESGKCTETVEKTTRHIYITCRLYPSNSGPLDPPITPTMGCKAPYYSSKCFFGEQPSWNWRIKGSRYTGS